MKLSATSRPTRCGYSFAEVLVASALLGLALGGAVTLTATLNTQHSVAFQAAVAQNYADNAALLWQLGLSPAEVLEVMPGTADNLDLQGAITPSGANQVTFGTAGTTTLANSMGTLENITCSVVIRGPTATSNRTLTLQAYRPTFR